MGSTVLYTVQVIISMSLYSALMCSCRCVHLNNSFLLSVPAGGDYPLCGQHFPEAAGRLSCSHYLGQWSMADSTQQGAD